MAPHPVRVDSADPAPFFVQSERAFRSGVASGRVT